MWDILCDAKAHKWKELDSGTSREGTRPWKIATTTADWQTYKRQRLHANISIIMATFVPLSRARSVSVALSCHPLSLASPWCIPSHFAACINYRFQMQKYEWDKVSPTIVFPPASAVMLLALSFPLFPYVSILYYLSPKADYMHYD